MTQPSAAAIQTGASGIYGYSAYSPQLEDQSSKCYQCSKKLNKDQINKCSGCMIAIYCGRECQTEHWKKIHKQECTPKKQEATSVALQKMKPNENKFGNESELDIIKQTSTDNANIRQSFIEYERSLNSTKASTNSVAVLQKTFNHPLLTQQFILEGCNHLDPQKSVVLVCGAQFYDGKFVEPLPELLSRCKKLILIDIDPVTLEQLSSLLNSPKVLTINLDLTNSLKDLQFFEKESQQYSKKYFIKQMKIFIEKLIKDTQTRTSGLGVLQPKESADYVISSLVGTQLSTKVKESLYDLFKKQFKEHPFPSRQNIPDEWIDLIKTFMEVMINKHLDDLLSWAGSSGTVYFADSIKLKKLDQIINATLVSDSCVNKIKSHLSEKRENVEERNWYWMENSKSFYDVKAFLCCRNKELEENKN